MTDKTQKTEADASKEQLAADAVKDADAVAKAKADADAQADAKAKAEADAQAKADADAEAAPETKKTAKKKAPVADASKLRELIEAVEAGNTRLHRGDLVARLELEEGAKLDDDGAVYRLTMAGITATATNGEHGALSNWCNAARRKCLSGAV